MFKKKCPICDTKYPKSTPFHELRLKTSDGTVDLEICSACADFFDKSADILTRGKKQEDEE